MHVLNKGVLHVYALRAKQQKKQVSCVGMFHSSPQSKSLGAFSSKWSRICDLQDNDIDIFQTRMAWKYLMWRGKGLWVHSSVGKRFNYFSLDCYR